MLLRSLCDLCVCVCVCVCQRESSNNVVVITPQLVSMAHDLRRTVSAHLVTGFIRSADLHDDALLDTANLQTTIRVNVYHLHDKAFTLVLTSLSVHITDGLILFCPHQRFREHAIKAIKHCRDPSVCLSVPCP